MVCPRRSRSLWDICWSLLGRECDQVAVPEFPNRHSQIQVEAAVALSYPEPKNQGRHLGWWMTFRVAGPVLGGAIK